jgi:hypothetical protein
VTLAFVSAAVGTDTTAFVDRINNALALPLGPAGGQVRDGYPPNAQAGVQSRDAVDEPMKLRNTNPIILLSCIVADTSPPKIPAATLARLVGTGNVKVQEGRDSAVALAGRTICSAWASTSGNLKRRHDCYHDNTALLLQTVDGMLASQRGGVTESGRWFRWQAATMLTHMYNGTPLPINTADMVYKSSITTLWMDRQQELFGAINANAADADVPPTRPLAAP